MILCFRHFMMNDTFQKLCENFNVKFVFLKKKIKEFLVVRLKINTLILKLLGCFKIKLE